MKVTVADILRLIEAGYESACINAEDGAREDDAAKQFYWGGRADALAELKGQIENGAVL